MTKRNNKNFLAVAGKGRLNFTMEVCDQDGSILKGRIRAGVNTPPVDNFKPVVRIAQELFSKHNKTQMIY